LGALAQGIDGCGLASGGIVFAAHGAL